MNYATKTKRIEERRKKMKWVPKVNFRYVRTEIVDEIKRCGRVPKRGEVRRIVRERHLLLSMAALSIDDDDDESTARWWGFQPQEWRKMTTKKFLLEHLCNTPKDLMDLAKEYVALGHSKQDNVSKKSGPQCICLCGA